MSLVNGRCFSARLRRSFVALIAVFSIGAALQLQAEDGSDFHHTDKSTLLADTSKMLESLSYPKSLRHVPLFASSHHERMDGKGYPKGLSGDDIPLQARIIAIADIFESLTAKNRPYKKGKTTGEALQIMTTMKEKGQIDPDLFGLFVEEKVYLDYARLN